MYYLKKVKIYMENMEMGKRIEGELSCVLKCGLSVECINHADAESVNDGVLWITDFEDAADYLLKCGCGVLIYLHAGNRDASFAGARYAFENPQELSPEYLERIYRRYAGIPWDILDTARCLIRETKESDIDAFYEIYKEPSITRYMENLYEDRDEEREYIRTYIEKVYGFYEFGVWTVIERKSGNIIGRAGLSYREGFEEPELGFVIGVPWQRQGYAYEVCSAILGYAKEQLEFDRVQVLVEPGNTASVSLCEKLGFTDSHSIVAEGKEYIRMLRSSQMSGR
jgi:RimJ/RimL family protein N-acetyltransferase